MLNSKCVVGRGELDVSYDLVDLKLWFRWLKLRLLILLGLRWRWFGHTGCIIGASSHVEGLGFSGDHHFV